MRDDFTKRTIETLGRRVGYHCSNPDCRTSKPPERRGRVLFINAVAEVTRERAQSLLEREHIDRIMGTYRDFRDVEGFARVATLDEIRVNQASLNLPFYILPTENGRDNDESDKPRSKALADWESSSRMLRNSIADMLVTLGSAPTQCDR